MRFKLLKYMSKSSKGSVVSGGIRMQLKRHGAAFPFRRSGAIPTTFKDLSLVFNYFDKSIVYHTKANKKSKAKACEHLQYLASHLHPTFATRIAINPTKAHR